MLLLKASIILTLFWLFYKFLLEPESYFTSNRFFLLLGLVVAFTLPQIVLPEMSAEQGLIDRGLQTVIDESSSVLGPAKTIELLPSSRASNQKVTIINFVVGLYLFGVFVLTINLLLQLLSILRKIFSTQEKIMDRDGTIVFLKGSEEPCSFLRHIFINPEKYNPETYEQILAHEQIHVAKWHSIDLLLSEFVVIILWFNPIAWLYRKEIEKNLEFETDQAMLATEVNAPSYQGNLLQVAVASKPLVLTTNYNQSLLKKRIMKMNAKRSHRYNYWKYVFMLPILVLTTILLNQPLSIAQGEGDGGSALLSQNSPCQALLEAVKANDVEKVQNLVSDTDPDCAYRAGGEPRSPLVAAARVGNVAIGSLLLDAGADPEYRSRGDETPLMAAARNGHQEFAKLLLKSGAEVDRRLSGDGTALINAARAGHLEVAKLLMESGADPYLNVPGDEYAMYHARANQDQKMIDLIKSYE